MRLKLFNTLAQHRIIGHLPCQPVILIQRQSFCLNHLAHFDQHGRLHPISLTFFCLLLDQRQQVFAAHLLHRLLGTDKLLQLVIVHHWPRLTRTNGLTRQ